jgi:MFS family permease
MVEMIEQAMKIETKVVSESIFSKKFQALTFGIIILNSVLAFEAMAVITILPLTVRDLGGLDFYGWAFSAFMLANLISTVIGGQFSDRYGPATPFAVATLLVASGLLVSGLANSMAFIIGGRALQGLGAGVLIAIIYIVISRGYPDSMRAKLTAISAATWMIPALVGPALAGYIAETFSWRWVFLAFVPLLLIAGVLIYPVLTKMLPSADATINYGQIGLAIQLALGVALLLSGLSWLSPLPMVILVVVGACLVVPAFYRLIISSIRELNRKLPTALLVRGLLNFVFFSVEAFIVLALTTLKATSLTEAGLSLTAGALSWTAASWWQARLDTKFGSAGRKDRIVTGLAILVGGVVLLAGGIFVPSMPLIVAISGWGVAGFGIGLAFPALTLIILGDAPEGKEGMVSGTTQLVEVFFIAIGTGVGGAIVAFGNALGWASWLGLGLVFVLNILVGLAAVALAKRVNG